MTTLICDTIRKLAQRKLPSHDQLTRNELMTEAYQPVEGFVDERTPGYVPSKEELDAAFIYMDGVLLWKKDRGNQIKAGMPAGKADHGYVSVHLKGRQYPAHRLIWAMHGNVPAVTIDHINRNRSDNRIENLRAATKNQQLFNVGLRSDNRSGVKGVSWHKYSNAWRGQVYFQGKSYHAGIFKNKDECIDAVKVLRERLHGEFACHAIAI